MRKWILAIGTCATLSTLPMATFAHGYDAGDAALGGLVGGVVGGLIGSTIAPYPYGVYASPAPVIVEGYRPAPVVVAPAGPPAVYYRGGYRGWHHHDHDWREHRGHRRHWDHDRD
jgi:hypothetical protein